MSDPQPNNPLHGIKLEQVVTQLQVHYGWDALAERVNINCFKSDPSVKSSLKFLRRTHWAREKVEALYVNAFGEAINLRAAEALSLKPAEALHLEAAEAPKSKPAQAPKSQAAPKPKLAKPRTGKFDPWANSRIKKT